MEPKPYVDYLKQIDAYAASIGCISAPQSSALEPSAVMRDHENAICLHLGLAQLEQKTHNRRRSHPSILVALALQSRLFSSDASAGIVESIATCASQLQNAIDSTQAPAPVSASQSFTNTNINPIPAPHALHPSLSLALAVKDRGNY